MRHDNRLHSRRDSETTLHARTSLHLAHLHSLVVANQLATEAALDVKQAFLVLVELSCAAMEEAVSQMNRR
eukprot:scaffold2552_cov380-Prasinococcus_capsulatus_cf.AAC.40